MKKSIQISNNTNNGETVKWIKKLAFAGTKNADLIKQAEICKNSPDPIKAVFDFAYDTAVYYPDPEGVQELQPVYVTLRDKKANCVDYTILQSSLLCLLGLPHSYRMVSYSNPKEFEHIYIVCNGRILDPVIGQKQDGTQTFDCRPRGSYNQEVQYVSKKDIPLATLEILQGTKNIQPSIYINRRGRTNASRVGFIGLRDVIKKQTSLGAIDWSQIISTGIEVGGGLLNQSNQSNSNTSSNTGTSVVYVPTASTASSGIDSKTLLLIGGVALAGVAAVLLLKK